MTMFRQPPDWPPYRHEGPTEPITPEAVVEMEKRFPARFDDGRKMRAVRARFGVSMTRYQQAVNAMLDGPDLVALGPIRTRILRERRVRNQRLRSARQAG